MTLDNEQIVRKAYQIAEDKDLMPVSACGPGSLPPGRADRE